MSGLPSRRVPKGEPGTWTYRQTDDGAARGLAVMCPGCGQETWLPINGGDESAGWDLTGDLAAPTLTPSVLNRCCGWHGWMRAGVLVSV